jgi:hypothetical protein
MNTLEWDGERAPLAKALVAAQKATESVKKAATNPAFRTKYADLSHVVEGVIPALNAAGVGVIQSPSYDGEMVSVTTTLLHESGSSVTGTLAMRPSKSDPQGVGSAITYGSRYSLMAALGLPPVDDDAEAALGRGSQAGPAAQSKAPAHTKPGEADLYVDTAIAALKLAKTEKALQAWFASEKTNRDKYGLKSGEGPGLRLMNAYGDHKAQLQSEVLAA